MPNKKYWFITDEEGLFFSYLHLCDNFTIRYRKTPENAVAFDSKEKAQNYARKCLSPFVNIFEIRFACVEGDFKENECLFSDI